MLQSGVVPDQWKLALVKPIPKTFSGKVDGLGDLRPISLLPVPLKVAELLLFEQLKDYLEDNKILPDCQSGFREGIGTVTSLSNIIDNCFRAIDKHEATSLTCLDMSRAFDSLDFDCLLAKLKYYGICGSILDWFRSYLLGRQQRVIIGTSASAPMSQYRTIYSGVPQGSVLGPSLFSLGIADIQLVPKYCTIHLYADDIQLSFDFPHCDAERAGNRINGDLSRISLWIKKNGLILNASKSQTMLVGSHFSRERIGALALLVDGQSIGHCRSVKSLGLTIDSALKFDIHVSEVCRKVYLSLKRLYPYKYTLNSETKKMLVSALVFSHFHYADVVYGPCLTNEGRSRLQKMQNHCVRFVKHVPRFSHITPFIRELRLFKLNELRFLHFAVFLRKILNTKTPVYLYSKLTRRTEIHNRELRRIGDIIDIPRHKTMAFRASFSYMASFLNNALISVPNVNKVSLKKHLKCEILKPENIAKDFNFNLF